MPASPVGKPFRPRPSAAVRDEEALQMRPAPCGYSSAHIFETILFFLLQKEKNGFNLPRKERGPVPTVVLNLTQKISAIIRPLRQSLPSERSLRSAHRLSAELPSKANICGRTGSSAPTRCDARSRKRADEGIGPYRMVRIRKTPPDRHHPDSVRRGEVH